MHCFDSVFSLFCYDFRCAFVIYSKARLAFVSLFTLVIFFGDLILYFKVILSFVKIYRFFVLFRVFLCKSWDFHVYFLSNQSTYIFSVYFVFFVLFLIIIIVLATKINYLYKNDSLNEGFGPEIRISDEKLYTASESCEQVWFETNIYEKVKM